MFNNVIGDWPKHNRFLLTSCDDIYFNRYFPRFYKTYTTYWRLPIHVHIIDPSQASLEKLEKLSVSHTSCTTDANILKWPYSYETYCQAQRFILLGHMQAEKQSVIVADVDSYALREPNERQSNFLGSDMSFSVHNERLMATFCNFHHRRKTYAKQAALEMQQLIQDTDTIGVDQLVIKKIFKLLPYNNLSNGEWIRHDDVKTKKHAADHNKCLIYHEKGTRGKGKGIKIEWIDIGL